MLQRDLLSHIFSHLNDYKDIVKFKLVCKTWKNVITEFPDTYWKRFVIHLYSDYENRENEEVKLNWFAELKSCHATGGWKFSGKSCERGYATIKVTEKTFSTGGDRFMLFTEATVQTIDDTKPNGMYKFCVKTISDRSVVGALNSDNIQIVDNDDDSETDPFSDSAWRKSLSWRAYDYAKRNDGQFQIFDKIYNEGEHLYYENDIGFTFDTDNQIFTFYKDGIPEITFTNFPRGKYKPFVMAKCGEYGEDDMGGEIVPLVIKDTTAKAPVVIDYNLLK